MVLLICQPAIRRSNRADLFTRNFSKLSIGGFRRLYEQRVHEGRINTDPRQAKVVDQFQQLADRLEPYQPPTLHHLKPDTKETTSWFSGLFGNGQRTPQMSALGKLEEPICRGLYLHGGTGTGKTMLMDLFFENLEISSKKRVHFHAWMLDVHKKLHALQKNTRDVRQKIIKDSVRKQKSGHPKVSHEVPGEEDDLVDAVADALMRESYFICFDEFQVTFISDAVIMRRLFSKLFERGAVVVATSNRPPKDLYLNGLNRELFTPFIPLLEKFCVIHDIDSAVDYRMIAETDEKSVYLCPFNERVARLFESKFYRLSRNQTKPDVSLEIQGRVLNVKRAAMNSAIAWFSFKELCDKPLGAADFLTIASNFHTVFIDNVPKLTLQERDQMRRFITLIDAFYDAGVRLICSADAQPLELFVISETDKKSASVMDEVFAWDRLVSRLSEMQSLEYLSRHSRRLSVKEMFGQYILNELTEEDVEDIWGRYDRGNNGFIEASELEQLIEDLSEHVEGHRDVPEEVLKVAIEKIDINADGKISKEEFKHFALANGLNSIIIQA